MPLAQEQTMSPDQVHVINSGSWGAAMLNFVYLFFMRLYAPAVLLAALQVAGYVVSGPRALSILIKAATSVLSILFIFIAKRLAWTSRPWRNYEDFLACQRVWDRWGKGLFLGALIAVGLFYVALGLWTVFFVGH